MILGILEMIAGIIIIISSITSVETVFQQGVVMIEMMIGALIFCFGGITFSVGYSGSKVSDAIYEAEEEQKKILEEIKKINTSTSLKIDEVLGVISQINQGMPKTEKPEPDIKQEINITVENADNLLNRKEFDSLSEAQMEKYKNDILGMIEEEKDDGTKQKYYQALVDYGFIYYLRFLKNR